MINYEEYEEYYDEYEKGGFQKNHKSGPSSLKKESHQIKQKTNKHKQNSQWEDLEKDDNQPTNSNFKTKSYNKKDEGILGEINSRLKSKTSNNGENKVVFTPGPNTHIIKNNTIDFDRVADIQKIENEYNGKITYGIKFIFTGKKGSSRVAWFNKNQRERDSVYEKEYAFWQSIKR